MLQSKVFLEHVIKKNIKVEPCKDSDKLQITVNGNFIREHIYESLECKVKEYAKFVIIENNTEEICRIYCDEELDSLLTKKDAKKYAEYLCSKINEDIKEILKIDEL